MSGVNTARVDVELPEELGDAIQKAAREAFEKSANGTTPESRAFVLATGMGLRGALMALAWVRDNGMPAAQKPRRQSSSNGVRRESADVKIRTQRGEVLAIALDSEIVIRWRREEMPTATVTLLLDKIAEEAFTVWSYGDVTEPEDVR